MSLDTLYVLGLVFLFGGCSGGCSFCAHIYFADVPRRKRRIKRAHLFTAFGMSGFLSVGLLTMYFGKQLDENNAQAIGMACLIGTSGISAWKIAAKRVHQVFGGDSDG